VEELRKTGIDVLGDVPWGTHFCQFYETKQDLLDILVPYFKAGLENNEFCMWITAEPLKEDEAKAAIAKVMPDFAQYQARGQIEILPYTEWHLKDGVFDGQRVLGSWVDRLNQSLARGYAGLRVSGNTFWLERNGWKNFTEYEAEVNNVISNYKMLALCTYSLDKCSASDVIDVISNHQLALLKKRGKWELIESPERKRAGEAAEAEQQRFNEVLDMLPAYLVLLSPDYHVTFANRFFRERFGESHGRRCFEYLFGRSEPCEICETYKVLKTMSPLEWEWIGPDRRNYHIYDFPFTDIDGSALIMKVGIDITEQKRAQADTQTHAEQQAVIAQLGQLALSGAGLDKLFYEAVKQVARTLDLEYCKVLELLPGGKELLLCAGVGWKEGLVGHATVGAGTDSQAGYTLLSDKPIIVEELRTEKRFSGTSLLFEHGVVSGVSVIILGREKPFGVLSAHTTRQRRFTEDDIHFLQGVANVLAGTIERRRAEEALRKAHDELEIRVEERTRELAEANTVLQAEIAERKKAAEALRESQQDLNRAQAVALTGSWRLDVRRNELLWSDETHRMFGIPRGTPMTYETFLSYVHPDDRENVDRKWTATLRGEPYDIEHRIVVGNEVKWVREKAELEFDKKGMLLGGFGTVQDITERKQAEEDLRETRDYLNNLLDYANAPIIVWDPSFRITRFNHAFERLTGLSWNNVVGKQLEILFPESEREESMGHIRRAVAGERWEVVEIPILRADGTVRTVLWNSATLYATDGKTVIATIAQGQDITERKQAEEEIIRLNEVLQERAAELEASNRELESFSYSVSHDLREPLRTIDGFSRILQKDYADKLDAEGQRLIDIVRGGTQKMAKLISDLLSFSRIGRKQMEMSEIDMNETVRSVSAELRSAAPDRNLRFNIKELPFAQGDPAMIRQVMVNLMSNAFKFTREKRLAIIQVGSTVQEGENIYYVKDNGVGFDTQYKDKLFRIFQRLHSEEEFEGTGVGLAIVYRIIHRHGGRVWAEGKVGHGATFYFTLPGKEGKS
jgi:PAS domain S-box-containing protein